MTQRITAFRNLLTALVFAVLITTPMLLHLTSGGPADSNVENRRLSPAPELSGILTDWSGLPDAVNAWMRDNFGLRRAYLKVGFEVDKLLNTSSAFKAVRGDDGWLFNRLNGALALHQGLLPFTAGEADAWLDGLVQVQQAAEASGANFVAMITPNKHTIYPEYLSAYPRRAAGETRLDEVQRLAQTRDLPLIDLRPALLAAKEQDQVYFKTDSHWTEFGAYLGFVELRAALAGRGVEIPEIPRKALRFTADDDFRGDLYGLLGEENGAPESVRKIKFDRRHIAAPTGSILFIGDSFAGQFLQYLEATFEEVEFVDNFVGKPDLGAIRAKHHDVVVYQVVERYLSKPFAPANPGN